jgi:tetratricopeptide (TPR) repeat protein
VWELRSIRRQLADRGLDWASDPLPDPPTPAGPIEVSVPISKPAEPHDQNALVTIARMTEYLKHDPELADPHHFRAHAWARLGRAARAEADFDEAVRLGPNDPTHLRCRAEFHFAHGRYTEAAADLDRILADAPAWSPPADLLARIALWHLAVAPPERLNGPRGHDLARRAASAEPNADDPLYRVVVGIGLMRTGYFAVAIDVLGEARGAAAGRYDALVYPTMALAHLALNDRTAAAEAIRRGAEAIEPATGYLRAACDRLRGEAAARFLISAIPIGWPPLR